MTSTASIPAGVPPLGVEPNFANPKSLYPQILATVILCTCLTTLFTFARLFIRWTTSAWALEDHLLVLAWAFNIAYDYLFLVQGRYGAGRHIWDVRAVDAPDIAKYQWIIDILYPLTIWLAKGALLFQLKHIFTPTRTGWIHWAIQGLIWGNLTFYVTVGLTIIFQCVPQVKIWDPEHKGGHCINFGTAALATGSVNVISDFLILLLPLVAVRRLRMAPKRKLGILAVFATVFLAWTSSICRLAYTTRFFTSRDSTYYAAQSGMWSLAEVATLILVTCFPVIPRFVQLLLSKLRDFRKTALDTGDTAQSLYRPAKLEAWSKAGDTLNAPRNVYIPLREHEATYSPSTLHPAGEHGIRRTTSIELTSHARSGEAFA